MINGRWIVWALLLLTGCGYRAAMERASAAHERKDWAAAAAGYEAALQHDPDDEEAMRGLTVAQRRWHAQSLSRFEKALLDNDLPAAREALAQAEAAQPGAPTNGIARDRLATAEDARRADALRTKARAQQQQARPLAALRLWAQAQAVHATAAGAQAMESAQAQAVERAKAAEAGARWADADAEWAVIAEVDPKAEPMHAALRRRWADTWRAKALAHDVKGHLGLAAVRAAQVAAISGRADDVERKVAWLTRHHAPYALRTRVQLTGPSGRTAVIEAALPPSASVDPKSTPLTITGALTPVRFTQSKTVKVKSARYQSGTRVSTNPDWVRARDGVRTARREYDAAEAAVRVAEERAHDAEAKVDRARVERRDRIRTKRRRLRKALARAREEEQRCQSAVRDASDANRASARSRLDRAQRAVDDAWRALDGLANRRDDSTYEARMAEQARRALALARDRADTARRRISEAERALDRVEPTTETPRYATHRFAVQAWSREGVGAAQLTVELPGLPAESVPLTARAVTRDRAHAAQVPLGLDADPLRFPQSDAAVVRAVDEALGAALAQVVAAQEARWARSLLTQALDAQTPAEQVDLALAAVRTRNASKDTIARARAILSAQADLRDLEILRAR